MKNIYKTNRSAFTLLELLIAMIILGILAVMVVFVYTKRADDARETVALAAVEQLAEAEAQVGVHTGYYCQLYYLDEPVTTDTITMPSNLSGTFVDPRSNPSGQIITNANQVWNRIRPIMTNPNRWHGPYVDFKKQVLNNSDNDGVPIDPWGNVYMFFTPYGYVDPFNKTVTQNYVDSNGDAAAAVERPTILSKGPDGRLNTSDDIIRTF